MEDTLRRLSRDDVLAMIERGSTLICNARFTNFAVSLQMEKLAAGVAVFVCCLPLAPPGVEIRRGGTSVGRVFGAA